MTWELRWPGRQPEAEPTGRSLPGRQQLGWVTTAEGLLWSGSPGRGVSAGSCQQEPRSLVGGGGVFLLLAEGKDKESGILLFFTSSAPERIQPGISEPSVLGPGTSSFRPTPAILSHQRDRRRQGLRSTGEGHSERPPWY